MLLPSLIDLFEQSISLVPMTNGLFQDPMMVISSSGIKVMETYMGSTKAIAV